jgi:hypothetical protein
VNQQACAQVANGYRDEQFKVVYKRPTDLALVKDVPICCNVLIADMFDEGVTVPRHVTQSVKGSQSVSSPSMPVEGLHHTPVQPEDKASPIDVMVLGEASFLAS